MSLRDIYAGTEVEPKDPSRSDVKMDEINALLLDLLQLTIKAYWEDWFSEKSLMNSWNPTGALQAPFVYNEPEH